MTTVIGSISAEDYGKMLVEASRGQLVTFGIMPAGARLLKMPQFSADGTRWEWSYEIPDENPPTLSLGFTTD